VGPGVDPLDWYLPLKGGKMEGPLYLFHDPKYPTEAVTKHYVDGMSFVGGPFMPEAGGTFTGAVSMGESALTLSATSPIDPLEAASKQYVDGLLGSVTAPFVPLSGATMTGLLVLSDDPVDPLGAATKQYVDSQLGAGVVSFNERSGAVTMELNDVLDVGGAPVDSPTFSGVPQAPTAPPGTNTRQLATTEFVSSAVVAAAEGVISFNTRTGAVLLSLLDVTSVGGAPLASPTFTGSPSAPTPSPGDNDTSIATTAFVVSTIASSIAALPAASVTSFNGRTGAVTLAGIDVTGAGGALLASPVFTGDPRAPTPLLGDNDTSIATTAFVQGVMANATTGKFLPLTGGTLAGPGNLVAQGTVAAQLYVAQAPGGYPQYQWFNPTGGADVKTALAYMSPDGNLTFQFSNDAGNVGGAFLQATRSGAASSSVTLLAPTISLNGYSQVNGNAAVTGSFQVNGPLNSYGVINGNANILALKSTGSAFIGSYHVGNSAVGMWNASNALFFGNADGNGNNPGPARMTLDASSNLWVVAAITGAYIHSTGTLDVDGNAACAGITATNFVNTSARVTCNDLMNNSGIFYVAGNPAYYMGRGGDGAWRIVEGGITTMAVDTSGSINARNVLTAGTAVFAQGGQMAMGAGGNGTILQMSPNWYWDWNVSTGTLIWTQVSGAQWICHADSSCYNNMNWVGGRGAYQDLSDERTKHDIVQADEGLAAILKIKPIRFRRIGDQFKEREEIGFSAQQLREVIPEAVTETSFILPDDAGDDPALAMATTPIIAALVNAVKELQEQIHQLRKHK